MDAPGNAAAIVLVVVAVVGNVAAAALSAGEAAVLRITKAAAAELTSASPARATRLARVLEDPGATAAAAAFARVALELVAATCFTVALAGWVRPWWAVLLVGLVGAVLVAVVIVQVSPRSLGRRRPARVLRTTSGLLDLVVRTTRWVTGLAAARVREIDEHDERDLQEMVDRVNESEAIEDDEREMLRSVFELSSTVTREVMVPRTDIVSVVAGTPLPKALSLFLRSGFSRVPVVGDSNDDLRGILYFKDVVRVLETGAWRGTSTEGSRTVDEVMRPALLVPESKPVDALLREFRSASSHLAMVVDEYGGIAGLVTIEDTLEEIVGELTDEHDAAPPEIEDLGDGRFRVPARLPVDELGDLFGRDLDDDDVDSVGGLLAKGLGKVPLPGSRTQVAGLELEADRVEGRRRRLATVIASVVPDVPAAPAAEDDGADPAVHDRRPSDPYDLHDEPGSTGRTTTSEETA